MGPITGVNFQTPPPLLQAIAVTPPWALANFPSALRKPLLSLCRPVTLCTQVTLKNHGLGRGGGGVA